MQDTENLFVKFLSCMKPKILFTRIKIPPVIPITGRLHFFHILTAHCSKTYTVCYFPRKWSILPVLRQMSYTHCC
jgi:hypothetical protein